MRLLNREDVWRGVKSAAFTLALWLLALSPARFSVAMRARGGDAFERLTRAEAGVLLDAAQLAPWVGWLLPLLLLGLVLLPWSRRAAVRWGPWLVSAPACVVLLVVTVTEQEVKAERGAFSTLAEMVDAGRESSFVEGAAGFLSFTRIVVPTGVMLAVLVALLVWARGGARWGAAATEARSWFVGFAGGWFSLLVAVVLLSRGHAALTSRLAPEGLGNPLENLIETSVDWVQGTPPRRPMDLLATVSVAPEQIALGAQRLGWPPLAPGGGFQRPLRSDAEPPTPAGPVLSALREVSAALFERDPGPIAVFVISLESFRGADLHALNPLAPPSLAPFVNTLAERQHPGVLFSRRTYQGGVRTAQGLASLLCGLGTLPYNLSLIRDLPELPLRCLPEILVEAGFAARFVYGSDASYDRMSTFLRARGVQELVDESSFPAASPRGAWGGVTDFVLVDAAVARAKATLAEGRSQLSVVMTLSNHSPYTPPADLPAEVAQRARHALTEVPGRATEDDLKRLTTYAYTDAAVARFFDALEREGLADRSVVVFAADHSTGDDYVWGPDGVDHETDQAKANVPFAVVLPPGLLARVDSPRLGVALDAAARWLEGNVLSLNDVPALVLALLSGHPGVQALAPERQWHRLGGQRTSPYFSAGPADAALLGINGVDECYLLDAHGARRWPYEDAVFLRTSADRARVTPRLIPAASTLMSLVRAPP